jgi:hypothetical protein
MATDHCEDYPCCGHTPSDPCKRQWYDEPGAFDKLDWDDIHGYEDEEDVDV